MTTKTDQATTPLMQGTPTVFVNPNVAQAPVHGLTACQRINACCCPPGREQERTTYALGICCVGTATTLLAAGFFALAMDYNHMQLPAAIMWGLAFILICLSCKIFPAASEIRDDRLRLEHQATV